jgi:hypothetical protein
MAYSSGSLIVKDDYNTFATGNAAGTGDNNVANLNTVWGAGTVDKGYGQSSPITAVTTGGTITATQWETLVSRLETIGSHQGTIVNSPSGSYSTITAGQTISILSQLSTDVTNLFNNRGNAAASGTDITTNGTTTTTSTWDVSAVLTQTVTFADANSARYFFNAGGMIRLAWSRSGGTTTNKNTDWTNLLTAAGTIVTTSGTSTQNIASTSYTGTTKIGGSGSPTLLTTTTGFYDLTPGGAATEIFRQYSANAPYTTNYIKLTVALNAASTVLTYVVSLLDDATDTIAPDGTGSGDLQDIVDGSLSQVMTIRPPSTTFLTSTWGTPSMNAPSWVLSS